LLVAVVVGPRVRDLFFFSSLHRISSCHFSFQIGIFRG